MVNKGKIVSNKIGDGEKLFLLRIKGRKHHANRDVKRPYGCILLERLREREMF